MVESKLSGVDNEMMCLESENIGMDSVPLSLNKDVSWQSDLIVYVKQNKKQGHME